MCKFSLMQRIVIGCLLGLFLVTESQAQLATNIAIDVRAMALGNAVTAAPPGISAIHYNPAGLAKITGKQFDLQFFAADFDLRSEFSAPVGYGFLNYSDDYVVCGTYGENGKCATFVTKKSKIEGASLPLPGRESLFDVPKIPFSAMAALPGFAIRAPGSKVTFANSISAPLAVGFRRSENDIGNVYGKKVGLLRLNYLTPSIGFEINDEWSVGATVNFAMGGVGMDMNMRAPNELTSLLRFLHDNICGPFIDNTNLVTDLFLFGLCNSKKAFGPFDDLANMNMIMTDSLAPNFHVGVLWEPTRNFSWGAVFQSAAQQKMSGKYVLTYSDELRNTINGIGQSPFGSIAIQLFGVPSNFPKRESGIVTVDLEYPAHFQTGIRWKFLNQYQVTFDLGWTNYAKWDAFNFIYDRNVTVLNILRLVSNSATQNSLTFPLGFRDSWSAGLGLEWYFNDRVTLRMGYEPRYSPIPKERRSPMMPITNTDMLGFGMTYKWDKYTEIDGTITFLKSKDSIPAESSLNANSTDITNIVYNPYAGLNIKTTANILYLGLEFRTKW